MVFRRKRSLDTSRSTGRNEQVQPLSISQYKRKLELQQEELMYQMKKEKEGSVTDSIGRPQKHNSNQFGTKITVSDLSSNPSVKGHFKRSSFHNFSFSQNKVKDPQILNKS